MNLSNLALKFNSLFTSGTFMYHASSMAANGDVVNTVEATSITSGVLDMLVKGLINIVLKVIYTICAFLLNLIELFQFVVCQILGITVDLDDYVVLDENNPLIRMLTNEDVVAVLKIIFGVAIVLIIVFTIFSIIRAEYKYATTGNEKTTSKGRIMMRSLRSFFTLGMFPLIVIFAVILINALLAGFNDVLRGEDDVTLAGQIFATSAYDGNNYRRYANQDIRVPIIVNFEDPIYLGQDSAYSTEELAKIYEHYGPKGAQLYTSLAELDFGSFNESVIYRNNALYNASSFNGFEQFVCTREQYYVMADFIDYAIKHNIKYYVKAMDDVDVSWRYVSNTIYDKETQSLKITYKDASNLSGKNQYTVVYQPSNGDVSTPISDAVKTISALLSIGEYNDITFNALNRLEDAINIVEWGTDKAFLKLSSNYRVNPTATDKLLLFERGRYEYNNSLNYTLSDLVEGVEVPVYRLDKRVFQASTVSFVIYETHYVIKINGTYYEVEYNEELKDSSGKLMLDSYNDHYYTIIESDFDNFTRTHSPSDDNVDIYGDGSVYYALSDGAYKDIIITKSNGTFDHELEDGYIMYSEYDDQVTPVLKQISWSEKLIKDLQIIYKDININHLMTTDKWLTQLGEYVSADNLEGEYTSNISTALIHPLGLILAELFLGEIEESDEFNLYGSLMFDGKFDDETMKALMLSLLGEDRYFAVKAEFEYFNEIFNVFMGPVLDEIAFYENFELMNGQEASVQLYTYKAYLCSVLISSSAAEWLGQTALELIGYTGLENAIIISSGDYKGYYKKYYELDYEYRKLILELYLENISILKSQFVDEGDRAYPEYMTALKHYMGRYPITYGMLTTELVEKYNIDSDFKDRYFLKTDETQFDERLDRVLHSYLIDDFQLEIVNLKHDALVDAYDALYNYIFNGRSYSDADAEKIWEFIDYEIEEAREDGNDDFTYATIEGSLNAIVQDIPFSEESIKNFLYSNYGSYTSSNNTLLNTYLKNYYTCVEEFVEEKLEYIIPDQSHKFNGMKEDLENDKFWALMQAETIYNSLSLANKNTLSGLGLPYNSLIDPKDNFFGLIEGDVEGKNDVAGWEDLVSKVNNIKKKIERIKDEDHPILKGLLNIYISGLQRYIDTQETIDKLNRYYITYGPSAIIKQRADISLEVVLNSKHYTVGQNFTRAKFVEYVLGNQVRTLMNDQDFALVFVDEGYEGLVNIETVAGKSKTKNSFVNLQDFLVELGDITAILSQMTNLVNVSGGSIDEVVIGAEKAAEKDLAGRILRTILEQEYLPIDIVRAFFDVDKSVSDGSVQTIALSKVMQNINTSKYTENNELLNTVLSYLLLTDPSDERPTYIDYSKLTLQELRAKCMQFLIDYEEQKGETTEQNQKRYLTVFAIACGDWTRSDGTGAFNNSWYEEDRAEINSFTIDKQSQAIILRLAGLDNRPYEELVGAEYTIDFETKGVDEANGDVFVICLFEEDTKMYVPFMMTNDEYADGKGLPEVEGETWASKFDYWNPYTEYYTVEGGDEVAYFPVIAKGIIDYNGMPTAIRENEGNIEYYRDGIVIHDVGKYGLSEYFVSADQIPVHHTGISYVANMFTKLFTGKSLVEKLVESNPRFAANSSFKFLYGKERTVTDVSIDGLCAISFNFDESACIDMEHLYTLEYMNIIVLIIATASIVVALWKAAWGVTQRMFDITIYFLLGPAVISVIPLRQDKLDKKKNVEESNDDAYSRWKDTLIDRLLAVFAYAIGFNIFFIIIPIVSKMQLFNSSSMFAHLPLFNNLSVGFLNELARVVFLVASAYLTTRAPALFSKVTKTGNGFKDGEMALGNVKSVVNEVKDHWSGQYAMDKIGSAKDKFMSVIPGVELGKKVYGKVQQASNAIVAKGAEIYLKAKGVPPDVAEKMGQALKSNMKQRQNEDKYYKEAKRLERASREADRAGEDDDAKKLGEKAAKQRKNLEENRKDHKETVKKYKP